MIKILKNLISKFNFNGLFIMWLIIIILLLLLLVCVIKFTGVSQENVYLGEGGFDGTIFKGEG